MRDDLAHGRNLLATALVGPLLPRDVPGSRLARPLVRQTAAMKLAQMLFVHALLGATLQRLRDRHDARHLAAGNVQPLILGLQAALPHPVDGDTQEGGTLVDGYITNTWDGRPRGCVLMVTIPPE